MNELTNLVTNAMQFIKWRCFKNIDYRTALGDDANTMNVQIYGDNKVWHSKRLKLMEHMFLVLLLLLEIII